MLEEWTPANSDTLLPPTEEQLLALTKLTEQLKSKQALSAEPTQQLLNQARAWIKLTQEAWQTTFAPLEDDKLIALAEFYVLAEMDITGFESKDQNPAIWVFKYLKSEQRLPEKSVIKALKQATNNRFIPYGNALG